VIEALTITVALPASAAAYVCARLHWSRDRR
jgi:hypothetical protein